MADRSVVIKLGLNVSGLVAGARTASKALGDVGARGLDWVGKNEQSINDLSNTVGAFGLAAVGAAGLAVKSFADFDQQMSFVAATGQDAKDNLDALRDAAIQAGQETAFSATEAAEGIEQLAKAGISAEDILAGGLSGALDLAAAGGISVGEAAEVAATAMTQFDLAGQDVVHVADLLAAGAGKAQGGVTELGQALAQSGLVASQTGLTIEETAGALSAFASAGLLGSDAGTSFKTMLQRLSNPTGEAADLMERLNVSAYDSQGNFVGLAEFSGQLQSALEDMTPAQRNATQATIFGSDAVRAASVLYDEGEEGIRSWIAAVDDQGYAAETAATRMDNLKGDVEEFLGALETALIGAGEGADGPLRGLVQGATDVVNAFNDMPAGAKSASLAIVGGGGLVALGLAGLGKLIVGISNTRDALDNLGVDGARAGRALRFAGAVGAIGGVAFALMELNKELNQTEITSQDAYEAVLALKRGEQTAAIDELIEAQVRLQETAPDPGLWGAIQHGINSLSPGTVWEMEGATTEWSTGLAQIDAELAKLAAQDVEGARASFEGLAAALGYQGDEVDRLLGNLPLYQEALRGTAYDEAAAADAAAEAGSAQQGMAGEVDNATGEIEDQTAALVTLVEQLQAAGMLSLSTRDAQRNLEAAIDAATEAAKKNGETTDITTEKGRANQAALDDIASSTHDLISAMAEQGASEKQLQKTMQDSRQEFIDTATRMGLTKQEAKDLADQLGLIPGDYKANVSADVDGQGDVDHLQRTIDNLRSKTITIGVVTRTAGLALGAGVIGGNARGTDYWRGGLTWVGEEGPEIVNLPRGAQIIPADESRQIAASTLVPFSPSMTSVSADTSGPAEFVGNLYLDSGEFLGVVRGEVNAGVSDRFRREKRGAKAGTGGAR